MPSFRPVRLLLTFVFALSMLSTIGSAAAQSDEPGASASTPVPLETAGVVGDFELTVLNVMPDANDMIMAYYEFNTEAQPGNQFFLVQVQVTYIGEATATPWSSLTLEAIGASDVLYSEYDNTCGLIPDTDASGLELFPGGTVSYNVCWEISSDDADSLSMSVTSFSGFDNEGVWFSLGNAPIAMATPVGIAALDLVTDSTREDPFPVGTAGQAGDFMVVVTDVVPVADDLVIEFDSFNEPPANGYQYFMVTVSVTNTGEETLGGWFGLDFRAVGDENIGYSEYASSCGYIPDNGSSSPDLAPDETDEFNVCWAVPTSDADSLVMYIDPSYSWDAEARVWFAIQP